MKPAPNWGLAQAAYRASGAIDGAEYVLLSAAEQLEANGALQAADTVRRLVAQALACREVVGAALMRAVREVP